MINLKGLSVVTDGTMKRIAISYDEIDESGKVINSNIRLNRIVTDKETLASIDTLENYAANLLKE